MIRRRTTGTLVEAIGGAASAYPHSPCPRRVVDEASWTRIAKQLGKRDWLLLDLWGDGKATQAAVHMALHDSNSGEVAVASLACAGGRFPSVARHHAPAQRLERALQDLFGYQAVGTPDDRPWLDHGVWGVSHPLGSNSGMLPHPLPYSFLPSDGEGLHQIPVGPVHAGIIEPGHFRFTANGETIVRLEERLGYVHKGIDSLMTGSDLDHAARLAGRTSGDSTVAFAFAFALAAETALDVEAPPRARWLRALMAELERLANHLGDIGAICNDAAFVLMHAQCGLLRELVLRAADACFGHRLMRDRIVPGGVAVDPSSEGLTAIRVLISRVMQTFPALVELYDNTASLQDRTVGTGFLDPALALQYGAGGYVGRASGRAFDARHARVYAPYDELDFEVPVLSDGDVNARVWIRIREVEQSLSLIEQILDRMPTGAVRAEAQAPAEPYEGLGLVEGFRGDVLAWLRLDAAGRVERCRLRDPSWFQWPLLEAAIEGNIVADFPLCNKSFNCSYAGHDL